MAYRSHLGRARGLGSAKAGTGHWWHQRVTAIANIPLVLWVAWSLIHLNVADYAAVLGWVSFPFNTLVLLFLIGNAFYHGGLGIRVVIEDYVHHEGAKIAALLTIKFILIFAAGTGIFAVLSIYFKS